MRCPECGSEEIHKIGFVTVRKPNPHRKQRYRCKMCGRTFYAEDADGDSQ